MGQWSRVNTTPSWKEKLTGKKDGKEDPVAAYRRMLRDGGDTPSAEDLPDTRNGRPRLSRQERREADRILRAGKPKRGKH